MKVRIKNKLHGKFKLECQNSRRFDRKTRTETDEKSDRVAWRLAADRRKKLGGQCLVLAEDCTEA